MCLSANCLHGKYEVCYSRVAYKICIKEPHTPLGNSSIGSHIDHYKFVTIINHNHQNKTEPILVVEIGEATSWSFADGDMLPVDVSDAVEKIHVSQAV